MSITIQLFTVELIQLIGKCMEGIMAYLQDEFIIPEEKNEDDFRSMNCEGCMCENCIDACSNCVRCYRAEYAEIEWEDYFCTENCHEDCD